VSAARRLVAAALVVLVAGSLYQLAVAVGLLSLGDDPGEGPPLDGLFFLVPVSVLIAGGVALVLGVLAPSQTAALSGRTPFRALPIAAAAFPLCRALAFDPYYLPAEERFRGVEPMWLFLLALLAIGATALSVRRPGPAAVGLTAVVMVASGIVAVGEGLH
jgi:hypothetical protein